MLNAGPSDRLALAFLPCGKADDMRMVFQRSFWATDLCWLAVDTFRAAAVKMLHGWIAAHRQHSQ